jgi:hypothetical protein
MWHVCHVVVSEEGLDHHAHVLNQHKLLVVGGSLELLKGTHESQAAVR